MALESLTSAAVTGDLLVVPLGATEQHGPHLPLGTDTIIASALAASVRDAVVAPALPYGSSGEHAGFRGRCRSGRRRCGSCSSSSFAPAALPRVLFVSTHGGNAEPLAAAVRQLRGEGREVWAWSPRWEGDAHAGRIETSLMLALAPELVGPARDAGNVTPLASLLPRLRAEGVRAVSPNGVLGDPAGASAEEGRKLLGRRDRRDLARGA